MTALIEFEQVTKRFTAAGRTIDAIDGVSLAVMRGQFITLVGPSGCGKSTLLNMAAGLFEPTRGAVRYDGRPVPRFNRRTGYMTQNDHLLPWRNVAGNIAVPLEIAGWPRERIQARVDALIQMVGLAGFDASYPVQLSGGMRKRCALARLLAYDPETLLLDEPFAALDAQLRLRMQVELLAICRRLEKTVLFVTHDLDEAAALADRVVVFSGRPGRIVRDVASPLPAERDLMRLRRSPAYLDFTAELWELLAPDVEQAR